MQYILLLLLKKIGKQIINILVLVLLSFDGFFFSFDNLLDAVDAIFVVVAVVVQQLQLKLPTNFATEVVVVRRLDSV